MTRTATIALQLVALLLLPAFSLSAALTKADLVGTYHLDASTLHGHAVPTNFFTFAIMLKADGSFVATNVPADFFFDYTPTEVTSEVHGTWKLRHESEGRSFFYTGENDYLDLDFTSAPGPGSWSRRVEVSWGTPRFRIDYHEQKTHGAFFYLTKQK